MQRRRGLHGCGPDHDIGYDAWSFARFHFQQGQSRLYWLERLTGSNKEHHTRSSIQTVDCRLPAKIGAPFGGSPGVSISVSSTLSARWKPNCRVKLLFCVEQALEVPKYLSVSRRAMMQVAESRTAVPPMQECPKRRPSSCLA